MNNVIIITDCDGVESNAIYGVFIHHCKNPDNTVQIFKVRTDLKIETPILERGGLLLVLEKKLHALQTKHISQDAQYFASIQEGYYFEGGMWHLLAAVGIVNDSGRKIFGYTSTVPIDVERFSKFVPAGDPLLQFPTGADRVAWLQEPLRACLKELLQ